MLYFNKLFLLFFILGCLKFFAQEYTVRGVVKDSSNIAIEFANVVLINDKNEIVKGTITDESGRFSLSVKKGEYKLSISFLGYKEWVKEILIKDNNDFGRIILEEGKNILDEVIIKTKKRLITKVEDKLILNIKDGNLSKGYNGVEILKYAPNVWVDNSNNILIHHKSAVVFVNGKKVNLQGSDLSNYVELINSEDIEKIEIQTNASANIDAENNGGVINIVTKKPLKGFKARVRSFYIQKESGYYTIRPSLNFSYGTRAWNVYGNYGYRKNTDNPVFNLENLNKRNNILYGTNGSSMEKNDTNNYELGFVYDITKNQTFGVESYGSNIKRTSIGGTDIGITQDNISLDNGNIKLNESDNNEIFNGILNYSIKFDSIKSKLNFYVDYTKQDIFNNNDNASVYASGFFNNTNEKNSSKIHSEIISPQIDFKKQTNLFDFEIGSKYTTTDRSDRVTSQRILENNTSIINNERTTSYDYNESIIAGYFSISKRISKYFLKAGLRYENTMFKGVNLLDNNDIVNQNYDNFFPHIYLKRKYKNNKSISVSYSRSTSRPSFSLLNNSIRKFDDFRFSIGNPNLKPEYMNKFNITLNTKNQTFNLYYSIISGDINKQWFLVGGKSFHQSQNIGTSKEIGIHYSLNIKIKKWWHLNSQLISIFREIETKNTSSSKPSFMGLSSNMFKINRLTSIDFYIQYISPFIDGNFTGAENFEANIIFKKTLLKDKLYLRFYINDIFNTIRDKNSGVFDDLRTSFYQKRKTRGFNLWLSYTFSTKHKINNKVNQTKNDAKNRL